MSFFSRFRDLIGAEETREEVGPLPPQPTPISSMLGQLRELAEQRTKEINAAYDALTRS